MPTLVRAALLGLALSTAAHAQDVRLTLADGRVVEGRLESFEQGRYRVRLAGGATRDFEERLVRDIALLDRGPVERRPELPPADAARAAFDRGDYEVALKAVAQALQKLEEERSALAELSRRASHALVERALEKRDAGALAENLRVLVPALPENARGSLFTHLAAKFRDLHRAAPDEAFTSSFAEVLARLADQGAIPEELRASLSELFTQLARNAAERKVHASAVVLYQGALRVDPRRRDALRKPLVESLAALAARRIETGDAGGALAAAREAAALSPEDPELVRLVEDADYANVRQEVDADYGADAPRLLREYVGRTTRPEHRAWAEQALARASSSTDPRTPEVAAQMRKYYPIKPGRYTLFRRADGEIQERIRINGVDRDGDLLKVYCTLREIYRDFATTKVYTVEIERDAVMLPTAQGREPLLRFPLRTGDAWTWSAGGRDYRRLIRSLGETVRTGSGSTERVWNDCLVVDFTSTVDRAGQPIEITSRSTYAPGVGLVKLEFLDPELKKYDLELVELGQE
ncbi:MAG TPA: hypothetical protein VEJ18_22030 [Planctomycetota bacterium]|nr:hypothetical protein [Planctomycetota bacterium]